MRIIGGQHRGTKLVELANDKTRPTSDRVRESIFNILSGGRFGMPLPGGIVIDLFAGTGALGLEALSRGAARSYFVENEASALAVLRANISKLKRAGDCTVIAANATSLAAWRGERAGVVFADAPYNSGSGLAAVAGLEKMGALSPEAVIIIETGKTETLDPLMLADAGLSIIDSRSYGKAMVHVLARPSE